MKESGVLEPSASVRWQEAKVFAEVNARDMALTKPNRLAVIEELMVWFKGVSLYHQGETGGAPTEQDRQMQKHILSVLISAGEGLLSQLRQDDITPTAGITLADVDATLEGLYDSQRVWFGGMTEARRAQILDEVFGAS